MGGACVPYLAVTHYSTLLDKPHNFQEKKITEHKTCLDFLTKFAKNSFNSTKHS